MPEFYPIEIVDLFKAYGSFVSVNHLNLKIQKNSFTGLLGPNGAGKSTTLKILTHLINATSGSAFLNGIDVTVDPKKALSGVGTVIETPEFYQYLTPRETFRYVGELIGMRREAIKTETEVILEKVKMENWGDKKLGTFSKGMRQRIALGQALLDNPSIIILDEPTSGLDPRGMAEIREILKNLRNDSKNLTIVMSSHILPEVEDLCDRIAMINHGTLLTEGGLSDFKATEGTRAMVIKTRYPPTEEVLSKIKSLGYVRDAQRVGNEIHATVDKDTTVMENMIFDVAQMRLGVYSISEANALEQKYLSMIRESR